MLKYHIQTVEVDSGGASQIQFNSIPQNYDDLYLVFNLRTNRADNSDSAQLFFNGVKISSSRFLFYRGGENTFSFSVTDGFLTQGNNDTANTFSNTEVIVSNYFRSNEAKPVSLTGVTENNASLAYQNIGAGLTPVTSSINSISVKPGVGTLFTQYSSASLYGVKRGEDKVTRVAPVAYGGVVTTSGGYTIHTFSSSGTFGVYKDIEAEYLVVAGAGGGGYGRDTVILGSYGAGGGGAGGYLTGFINLFPGQFSVIVGGGGLGGQGSSGSLNPGFNGSNSSVFGFTAIGGGGGGGTTNTTVHTNGRVGGSGGGGAAWDGALGSGGAGTAGQGNAGGNARLTNEEGGGGGGAGGLGASSTGYGGIALGSSISGTLTYYSGGGGGGLQAGGPSLGGGTSVTSQKGGAGNGGTQAAGGSGTANTGGGGGGAYGAALGGSGGSGIVIIRYLTLS
jgi:hypothetical protein